MPAILRGRWLCPPPRAQPQGRVADAALALGLAIDGEASVGAHDDQVDTRGAPLALRTSREVRVGMEMNAEFGQCVADPTYLTVVKRELDVAHETVQCLVAQRRPFVDLLCKFGKSAKQVVSSVPSCV